MNHQPDRRSHAVEARELEGAERLAALEQFKPEPEDMPGDFSAYEPWPFEVRVAAIVIVAVVVGLSLLPLFVN